MPARARSVTDISVISCPSSRMRPSVGRMMPAIKRASVDFPLPFGPVIATKRSFKSRLISDRISVSFPAPTVPESLTRYVMCDSVSMTFPSFRLFRNRIGQFHTRIIYHSLPIFSTGFSLFLSAAEFRQSRARRKSPGVAPEAGRKGIIRPFPVDSCRVARFVSFACDSSPKRIMEICVIFFDAKT